MVNNKQAWRLVSVFFCNDIDIEGGKIYNNKINHRFLNVLNVMKFQYFVQLYSDSQKPCWHTRVTIKRTIFQYLVAAKKSDYDLVTILFPTIAAVSAVIAVALPSRLYEGQSTPLSFLRGYTLQSIFQGTILLDVGWRRWRGDEIRHSWSEYIFYSHIFITSPRHTFSTAGVAKYRR